ncbi:aspartate carbamoyltransferase regulatory subunit [Clostridium algoriphilum]|uniref:aspartate carbamoyltransferase regulatory subunit n=1 Tax=Clostridium algoriphilum TaxID=198347 RepID=UPI001CF16087|nr:aspartate carbamoyltransferase regulatory subunit [Clostridium algoriphilum]MCB2292919.1 aspartate carbamoyltransferase regulatory subunit [Clostridium algoriphilum]
MVRINSIQRGIVIDHIKAGVGLKIFNYLGLDKAEFTVALIMNAPSGKLGRKDIIKIENEIDIDFTVLGFIDPNITIDIITGEKIESKIKLNLPDKIENVIKCSNPRCITSTEQEIQHSFYLSNRKKGEYRCMYCDEINNHNNIS